MPVTILWELTATLDTEVVAQSGHPAVLQVPDLMLTKDFTREYLHAWVRWVSQTVVHQLGKVWVSWVEHVELCGDMLMILELGAMYMG